MKRFGEINSVAAASIGWYGGINGKQRHIYSCIILGENRRKQ